MSVLLHSLLLAPNLLGSSRTVRPKPQEPSASGSRSEEDAEAMVVEFLSASDVSFPVHSPQLQVMAPVDVSAPDNFSLGSDPPSSAEGAGNALLFGRYMSQISARIERAWLRPRSQINAEKFSCRVRIEQDASGALLEIGLVQCNGDTRWQLSLVHAIQSASPFPAPPDPAVFARTFHLTFQAASYSADAAPELYEPADSQQP